MTQACFNGNIDSIEKVQSNYLFILNFSQTYLFIETRRLGNKVCEPFQTVGLVLLVLLGSIRKWSRS